MRKFLVLALALAAGVVGGRWLWIALHVGAGYAAKVTCSLVLNSGQDAGEVVRDYVSREVAPLGALLRISAPKPARSGSCACAPSIGQAWAARWCPTMIPNA